MATDIDGIFNGTVELAHRLVDSDQVKQCITRQWFRFALGRTDGEADRCSMARTYTAFAQADFNVRDLLLAIVASDSFRHRTTALPTAAGDDQ